MLTRATVNCRYLGQGYGWTTVEWLYLGQGHGWTTVKCLYLGQGHGWATVKWLYLGNDNVSPPNIVISPWLRHFTRGSGDFNHGPGHFLTVEPAYMTTAHGWLWLWLSRFAELSGTVDITSAGLPAARTRLRTHLDLCDIGKFRGDLCYEGGHLINYGYNFLEIVIFYYY